MAYDLATAAPPPAPQQRPALALWLFERGIDYREAGRALGVSHEIVRLWCLPFGDPDRVEPRKANREKVFAYTRGAVPPDSFTPPTTGARA
ncbi:hypothetical protein [Phenylobacterium sp.]|uniref:hypothetical protein n=1 Tax=Phenylobacterium sp. TaxID=1871053 RepID=UPI003951BE38